jgi:hypothetical protein
MSSLHSDICEWLGATDSEEDSEALINECTISHLNLQITVIEHALQVYPYARCTI